MLNIRNVARNVTYIIVHSMDIVWGIKGYLFWLFQFEKLTNPLSSEIFAKISWTGLGDNYLLSVI